MELTIKANTIDELAGKINALAKYFNVDFSQMPLPVTATETQTVVVVEETKKGKKLAKKDVEVPKKEVEVKVTVENKLFTKEDVMAAFKKVQETANMEKARGVLAQFKNAAGEPCKRLSEIQEADYAMAVKACDEATAV